MECNGELYISTVDTKEVYKQWKENFNIQVMALKPDTREWIRINGIAKECHNIDIKNKNARRMPCVNKTFSSS